MGEVLTIIQGFQLVMNGFDWMFSQNEDGQDVIIYGDDTDDDGIPDLDIVEWLIPESSSRVEKSFIIMSADGTMTVYDESGSITAEDCDTAYGLWVSENGIMSKPLNNYTVTEGLLLIAGIAACFGMVFKFFRRRKVM